MNGSEAGGNAQPSGDTGMSMKDQVRAEYAAYLARPENIGRPEEEVMQRWYEECSVTISVPFGRFGAIRLKGYAKTPHKLTLFEIP